MSRLVYEGDLNKNFGEFFPTPYIDKIVVGDVTSPNGNPGVGCTVTVSLLFTVPEHDPSLPDRDREFMLEILNRVKINLLITKASARFPRSPLYPSEELAGRYSLYYAKTGTKFVQEVDKPFDELELLLHDPSVLSAMLTDMPRAFPKGPYWSGSPSAGDEETIIKTLSPWVDESGIGMGYIVTAIDTGHFESALDSGEYLAMYDRTGRKFLKLTAEVPEIEVYTAFRGERESYFSPPGTPTEFVSDPTINVLAFSSLVPVTDLEETGLRTTTALNLLFGDVAYERVLDSGVIANQTEESYFDDNGDIYIETPLLALNGRYYKADATTHEDIVTKFNQLINSYVSLLPATPEDAINTDAELMGSVEVIQTILQEKKTSVDLLKQLVNARKLIINRSPGTRSGALYADMATLLGRANSAAIRGTPLTKKLTVNAKIFDKRRGQFASWSLPSYNPRDADRLTAIQWGRTIVTGQKDSGVNIAGFLGSLRGEFADLHEEIIVGEDLREQYIDVVKGGSGVHDVIIRYEEDGSLRITYTTADGTVEEAYFPEYRNLFESEIYGLVEEKNVMFGYAWFDYRRAMIQNSTLATLVDVDRFIEFFGIENVQRYFVPHEYRLTKYGGNVVDPSGVIESPPPSAGMEMPWNIERLKFTRKVAGWPGVLDPTSPTGIGGASSTMVEKYYPTLWNGTVDHLGHTEMWSTVTEAAADTKFTLSNGNELVHYATERNVDVLPSDSDMAAGMIDITLSPGGAGTTTMGNWAHPSRRHNRNFAVEFQMFDEACIYSHHDWAVYDNLKFEIDVADYTKSALVDVIKHYYFLTQALKAYTEDASLECSYNNIDGVFNDFFAEQMTLKFATNPAAAPWIFCVVAYVKHLDFITGVYMNNSTAQLLAARDIIQKISPQTGTLPQLKAFYDNFISLYETYYSPSSNVGRELELLTAVDIDLYDYSVPYRVMRTYSTGKVEKMLFSAQNEGARDAFYERIEYEKNRLEEASTAYAEALGTNFAASVDRMRQLFERRADLLEAKVAYEAGMLANKSGGCKHAWWWDGWNDSTVQFPESEPNGSDVYGISKFRSTKKEKYWSVCLGPFNIPYPCQKTRNTAANAWKYIGPDGVSESQYGYVWVNKASSTSQTSKVVDFYDVDTYGEPTVFANFRRDRTGQNGPSRCRYVNRAYRIRASDFRYDHEHNMRMDGDRLDNKFGGYYGEPTTGTPLTLHTEAWESGPDANKDDLRALILGEYQGEGGADYYLKRLPGYELIRHYSTFDEWHADAQDGVDKLDYTPYQFSWEDDQLIASKHAKIEGGWDPEDLSQLWNDAYDPVRQGISGWTSPAGDDPGEDPDPANQYGAGPGEGGPEYD